MAVIARGESAPRAELGVDRPHRAARYAWLSVGAALGTLGLKTAAWAVTGSVGLLSDALESVVNLVAAAVATWALRVAAAPPDDGHPNGHDKAEYLSSGVEGALIVVAAIAISASAAMRLGSPRPLADLDVGLVVSLAAAMVNLIVARMLLRAGRALRSIALEADGRHLMTDVWTSGGVLAGLALVAVTGHTVLDPLIAFGVALHILGSGYGIVRRSIQGLMDPALPTEERRAIARVLDGCAVDGVTWHALRTRRAGARSFVSLHLLVPGAWTVQRGHDLAERIEEGIRAVVPGVEVMVHVEPMEDPRSHRDEGPADAHATHDAGAGAGRRGPC